MVLLLGQEFSFTKWGIVSGLFWVPGGAFNIFAIRNAGLAISQGIVASSIVMVSFVWGNLIFREPVKSQMAAYFAVWLIMAGLYGMSYFSTAETLSSSESSSNDLHRTDEEKEEEQQDLMQKRSDSFDNDATSITEPLEIQQQKQPIGNRRSILILGKTYSRRNLGLLSALLCGLWGGSCLVPMHYSTGDTNGLGYVISFSIGALLVTIMLWILEKEEEQQDLMQKRSDSFDNDATSITEPLEIQQQKQPIGNRRSILILGKTYSRRNLGLLSALLCGLWGGSCLVPMHYSTGDTNGLGYVISFSIGALLVTIMLWILRFFYQLFKLRNVKEAYEVLPSFHFR